MRWILLLLLIVKASSGQLSLGPTVKNVGGSLMMNMAMITNLDVDCQKEGMTVHVEFSQPFDGIIFSKGHYNDPECRYVSPASGRTSFTFDIPSQNCGSEMESVGNTVELSNVIVVQNDNIVQEIWDVARHIKCNWTENFKKRVKFDPVAVGMLNAEEAFFKGDDSIECWMNIQLGSYPDSSDINSIVRIGDTLSLLIYIRDNKEMYDVSVRDCYAYGGSGNEAETQTVQLTDTNGCVLKDKLISDFYTERKSDDEGSVLVSYAYVQAFKFPDVMDVHMDCNMEICKGQCEKLCGAITTTEPPRSGSTLFGEPIYTKAPTTMTTTTTTTTTTTLPPSKPTETPKPPTTPEPQCYVGSPDPRCPQPRKPTTTPKPDCFPGSTDLRCPQPTTTPKPKCYPGSTDPRCPQPTTTPKPKCYPGSTDPRCLQPTTTPKPKCYPGSTDPECRESRNEINACYPGSRDPKCEPKRTTTTPVTKTTRSGSSLFPDHVVTTTRKPKTTTQAKVTYPSPSLKPDTSNRVKQQIIPKKEPKTKPEPSSGEWAGEPRFHAFHTYHYDKGDGRRTRNFKSTIPFGTRLKREVNMNKHTIKTVKMTSAIKVANLEDYRREKREIMDFTDEPVEEIEFINLGMSTTNNICLSFNTVTFGLSTLVFLLFITTSTSVLLLMRQRHNK